MVKILYPNVDHQQFVLPANWSDGNPDNVVTHGETISVPHKDAFFRELHVIYAGDWIDGESNNRFRLNYADGSSDDIEGKFAVRIDFTCTDIDSSIRKELVSLKWTSS